jgi:hypothetical protein
MRCERSPTGSSPARRADRTPSSPSWTRSACAACTGWLPVQAA